MTSCSTPPLTPFPGGGSPRECGGALIARNRSSPPCRAWPRRAWPRRAWPHRARPRRALLNIRGTIPVLHRQHPGHFLVSSCSLTQFELPGQGGVSQRATVQYPSAKRKQQASKTAAARADAGQQRSEAGYVNLIIKRCFWLGCGVRADAPGRRPPPVHPHPRSPLLILPSRLDESDILVTPVLLPGPLCSCTCFIVRCACGNVPAAYVGTSVCIRIPVKRRVQ